MTRDIMLHFTENLTVDQRESLQGMLAERFGIEAKAHDSGKPHLLFLACDPLKAPPHAVQQAVQAAGYDARLVDL